MLPELVASSPILDGPELPDTKLLTLRMTFFNKLSFFFLPSAPLASPEDDQLPSSSRELRSPSSISEELVPACCEEPLGTCLLGRVQRAEERRWVPMTTLDLLATAPPPPRLALCRATSSPHSSWSSVSPLARFSCEVKAERKRGRPVRWGRCLVVAPALTAWFVTRP